MSTNGFESHDDQQPDLPFDRLRAGDPAATAEPDTTVIRAKVDAVISAEAGAPVGASQSTSGVVDLAAQRQARRAPRWVQVAAAAAGIVAVGGGAFFAGQQTSDTPISAETAEAQTQPTAPEGPSADAPTGGPAGGFAAGAQDESARSASAMDMMGNRYGRTVFTSSGLSGDGSSAQAWGFDPSATFTAETASRLAAVLGVSGDAVLNYGSWTVGSLDWTAPSLSLSSDGQTTFSYSNPAIEPWAEKSTTAGTSADEAIAALTAVMVEMGIDPAGYSMTADTQDPKFTSVTAAPLNSVEGTGTWYAGVTTDGLYNVNGAVAPLVDLGSFDVVSPQIAVERLSDERFGASQSFGVYPADDMGIAARGVDTMPLGQDDPAAVPTLPPAPVPGGAIAWPVTSVTITAAALGTSSYYQPDGSVVLLPTYTLTGSDGSSWTVLAVADAHLNFAATS